MRDVAGMILITPANDPESLLISDIATALGIPILMSAQPHGARLEREPDLVLRIREVNPHAKTLIIVEIPGPAIEEELEVAGFRVVIIDHHRYDGIDRMRQTSSLEQVIAYFAVDDALLRTHGFDPTLVRGVGAIDRGFVWELAADGLTEHDQRRVRAYFRDLSLRVGGGWEDEEREARKAWGTKREEAGMFVVESERTDMSIRAALSFILADEIGAPHPMLIRQGDWRVYVQDSVDAKRLYETFGGFTFGRDRCWGFSAEQGKPTPSIDAILDVIRSQQSP